MRNDKNDSAATEINEVLCIAGTLDPDLNVGLEFLFFYLLYLTC